MTAPDNASDEQADETAVEKRDRIVETRNIEGVTYSLEWTRCGHADRCLKCKANYYGHGPYWHARYWDPELGKNGRTVTKYIGRDFRLLTEADKAGKR